MADPARTGPDDEALLAGVTPLQRLALAYGPARARRATLAMLALDGRLATLIRGASEPLLAQIKLAWWRDRLNEDGAAGARGEPVLAALRLTWHDTTPLVALIDGWESLIGERPLPSDAFAEFAEGRARAFAALAHVLGEAAFVADTQLVARRWALADIAVRVTDRQEQEMIRDLAARQGYRVPRLPRALRPLVILDGAARRQLERGASEPRLSRGDVMVAIRLGIVGR